jgi:hypothetical protein
MSILSLTKDPLTVVLGFLNIKELGRMALINHSIRDVEEDDRVWNAIHDTLLHNINNDINPQLGTTSLFDEDLEIAHLTRKIFVRILVSDHLLYPRRFNKQLPWLREIAGYKGEREVAIAKIKTYMEKNDVFAAEWLCKHFDFEHGKLNFIQRTITTGNGSEHDSVTVLAMEHPYMPNGSFTISVGDHIYNELVILSLKDCEGNIEQTQLYQYFHQTEVYEYIRQNFSRLTYFRIIECGYEESAAKAAAIEERAAKAARILDKCRPKRDDA